MTQDDHTRDAPPGGRPTGSPVSDAVRLTTLAADWTWETDAAGVTTVVGAGVARLLGQRPEDMVGRPVFDHMPPEDAARGRQWLAALGQNPQIYGFVHAVFQHRDGHRVHIEVTGQPVFDDEGRHAGYRGIARDVTPQRERLRQLADEARRWRLLFDRSKDGIVVLDRAGRVREANQRYCEMLGYARDELLRLSVWDFDAVHTRDHLEHRARTVSVARARSSRRSTAARTAPATTRR